MHSRLRRAALPLIVTATLLSGCGGSGSGTPSGASATSTWDQVRSHIGKDGRVSPDTALLAFTATIGPLPGSPALSGPRVVVDDATAPLRWLLRQRDHLTQAQQKALDGYLAVSPDATPSAVPASLPLGSPPPNQRAQIQKLAKAADASVSAHLGRPDMAWDIQLDFPGEVPASAEGAYGYADVVDSSGGRSGVPALCHIHITPLGASQSTAALTKTVTHEIFHCFQAEQFGSVTEFLDAPAWLIEGSATWVAGDLTGVVSAGWWQEYLTGPETPLFQRTYDAVGFYAHLKESGDDPWARFDAMFDAYQHGGDAAALSAGLGSQSQQVLDTWAPGFLRDPALDPSWDTTGPDITADKEAPATITVTDSAGGGESLGTGANSVYVVDAEADIIFLDTPDHSRAHAVNGGGLTSLTPRGTYCARQGGCACPSGSSRDGSSLPALAPGPFYLAVSGGTAGSQWSVAGESLDSFCSSAAVDPCLQGRWVQQTFTPLPDTHGLFTFPDPLGIVYVFSKNGDVTADFSAIPPITATASDGTSETITFSGTGTAHVVADHGLATTSNADLSQVAFNITVNGINVGTFTYGQLFGPAATQGSGLSFVTYRCGPHSLSVTTAAGGTATFSR